MAQMVVLIQAWSGWPEGPEAIKRQHCIGLALTQRQQHANRRLVQGLRGAEVDWGWGLTRVQRQVSSGKRTMRQSSF